MIAERCDAGTLELGAGLEVLVSVTLRTVPQGGALDVVSASRSSAIELASWARVAGHTVIDEHRDGSSYVVRLQSATRADVVSDDSLPAHHRHALELGDSFPTALARRAVGAPAPQADPGSGLVPLGALAEPVSTAYNWTLSSRDRVWVDRLASLTDRAASAQWNATTDIPWAAAQGLKPYRERAVAQVATYIAQNEYAAYYVPARFLAQVHPSYLEVLMWLASHVHDEARHIEVFTKRALIGGEPSNALAATELSLHTLLDERDFSVSTLLLNVLGEGTFLDLLSFVARYAPDAATAAAARLAHRDERRHVQFGIAHVRRRLRIDPQESATLVAAVERRASKLVALDGLSPVVGESLLLMAAPSMQPSDIDETGRAIRALMTRMHENRTRRLRAAGFDEETAGHLSELHTPNLM